MIEGADQILTQRAPHKAGFGIIRLYSDFEAELPHMVSIAVFSRSTWPSIVLRPSARAYWIISCINFQPRPRPLRSERSRWRIRRSHSSHRRAGGPRPAGRRCSRSRRERHGAGVVDLGQSRDERVAEVLDRGKEAQPHVLRRDLGRRPVERLVLGADRTHEYRRRRSDVRSHCSGRAGCEARMTARPARGIASGAIATRASSAITPSRRRAAD